MNRLNGVQVEQLIESIKQRPLMYNKSDKYYKHVAMKEKIWLEIAENIGADEKDCKIAWKSLRDQFVKAAKEMKQMSWQESKEKKTYKYYEQLLFLTDSLQPSKRARSFDEWKDETVDSNVIEMSNRTFEQSPSADDDRDPLEDFLTGARTKTKSAVPQTQGENENFFSYIASMMNMAHLTPVQTRRIHRKVFNLVADELDKIDSN